MGNIGFINFGVGNFYLQILSLFLMFCINHERRKLWWLRLSVSTLLGLGFFFLFPKIGPVDWWNGAFLCVFALNIFVMKFTFKVKFRQIVIYGIAAATMQNLIAKLVTIFFIIGEPVLWERSFLQLIINDVLFVFACAIFWRLFIWHKQEKGGINIDNVRFAILLSVMAANIFLFSFLCDILVVRSAARVLCMCLLIVIDVMVLCAEFGVFEQSNLEKENETVERMLSLQDAQRKMFENSIDLINQKCHDIRHQLARLRAGGGAENANYIKELEHDLAGYELNVKTGNEVLDIVLTEYCLRCKRDEIRFTYMVDGKSLAFMESSDLYSFFGNALENAAEALVKVPDQERRLLHIAVERQKGVVLINIENYFCGKLKMNKNLPKTTKGENGFHGYGLKSIQYITQKYDGDLSIFQREEKFVLQAIFPGRE